MTDYSTLKTRALQLLGDPDGTRYDDATLQEAFRQALATYTRTCPQVRTEAITFASAGVEQPLDEPGMPAALPAGGELSLSALGWHPAGAPRAVHAALYRGCRLAALCGWGDPRGGGAGAADLRRPPHPGGAGWRRNRQHPKRARRGDRAGGGGLRRAAAHPPPGRQHRRPAGRAGTPARAGGEIPGALQFGALQPAQRPARCRASRRASTWTSGISHGHARRGLPRDHRPRRDQRRRAQRASSPRSKAASAPGERRCGARSIPTAR